MFCLAKKASLKRFQLWLIVFFSMETWIIIKVVKRKRKSFTQSWTWSYEISQDFIIGLIYHKYNSIWFLVQKSIVHKLSHKLQNDLRRKWIRRYLKNLKTGWRQSLVPSLPTKNKTLVIATKNYKKAVSSFLFVRDFAWFLYWFHKLCPRL